MYHTLRSVRLGRQDQFRSQGAVSASGCLSLLGTATSPRPRCCKPVVGKTIPTTQPRRFHLLCGRQPSRPPMQARSSCRTAISPQLADASTPRLLRALVVAPEQLSRPPHPTPSSSVASAAAVDGNVPPADRLRSAPPNCSTPSSSILISDGNLQSTRPGGTRRRLRPCTSSVPPSRPPNLPAAHPLSISPTLGPRNVPWHSGPFPRPPARELPAPGSGGVGATCPTAGRGPVTAR
jgi:hypothetical protein